MNDKPKSLLYRIVTAPFFAVVAVVLLVEEFLWEPLQDLAKAIGRLPVFRTIERKLAALPPTGALLAFLTPSIILVPFKILALAAFARGMMGVGLAIAITAKVVGTALVSRIFTICKPTLLTVPWFKRAYLWVTDFRTKLFGWIKNNAVVVAVRLAFQKLRITVKSWFTPRA